MSLAHDYAGPGHNLRDPLDVEIEDALQTFRDQFDARKGEVERCRVTNDDEAARATALAGILIDIENGAEDKRVAIKEPHLAATKKIDGSFGVFKTQVKAMKDKVVAMIDVHRKEQERKAEVARRQAEREAQEAAEKARAAEAAGRFVEAARLETRANETAVRAQELAAPVAIRSAYGHSASGRAVFTHQIVDRKKLPKQVTDHPKVLEAINGVIAAMVRSGTREIPGVRIFEDSKTTIRR